TAPGVHSLWRIGSAVSSLTVNVLIEASDAGVGVFQPADVYFDAGATHRKGNGISEVDRSHVDLAFYTSTCGDSQVDGTEQCDLGSGTNGQPFACCTATCAFRVSTVVCRASTGVCDPQETCTGGSAACPGDTLSSSTTPCRASA